MNAEVLSPTAQRIFEDDHKTSKMSPRRIEELRKIAEYERRDKIDQADFIRRLNTLLSKRNDTGTLATVLSRCSTDQKYLERRANKLRLSLHRGLQPSSVHDVLFLACLTRAEEKMTDRAFARWMDEGWAMPPIPSPPRVTEAGCALGQRCLRKSGKVPAPVLEGSKFCSDVCRGRSRVLARIANSSKG
jgi:hypothetical protein